MKTLLLCGISLLVYNICGQSQPTEIKKQQVDQALKKSAEYFQTIGADVGRKDVVMLLFILEDHFNYPLGLPSLDKYKEKDRELASSYFRLYDTYFEGRNVPLFDDNTVKNYLEDNLQTTDGLTVWSMFCEKFPLPGNYMKILEERTELGEYAMTHAALQLGNSLQSGCISSNTATEQLREKLIARLKAEANSSTENYNSDDLKYQSLAMLFYLGRGKDVTASNIDYIIKNQLEDGGWSPSKKFDKISNPHTSVLALWVLLEYMNSLN